MCKYCEEDKRKKRDCIINTPIVSLRIIRNNGFNALAIKSYNLEKQVVDSYQTINYCPKCRKEAGRVKHITLKEMLEEIIQCILEQKEIKDYYWKDGEEEFRRITEIDLLDRIRTSNDDFTEFEWELAESRLYKVE